VARPQLTVNTASTTYIRKCAAHSSAMATQCIPTTKKYDDDAVPAIEHLPGLRGCYVVSCFMFDIQCHCHRFIQRNTTKCTCHLCSASSPEAILLGARLTREEVNVFIY